MNRKTDIRKRFPGYYNQFLLDDARKDAGLSLRGVAAKLGMNHRTVLRAFKGTAHQKQVWPIARFLKLDWAELHDLNLPKINENHRAASRAVR